MYAMGLTDFGGPDVLKRIVLPTPHPAPGQVRVLVRTAGINPVDVMVRDGSLATWFAGCQPPFVPGMDIAGTIDEMGENIDPQLDITLGQNVVGLVDNYGSYGGYSQYVCVPAASVIPIPDGLAFPAAASFLMNALTARHALDTLRLPTNSTLLVTGAAGAVGTYTVELAAAEGIKVVAIASANDETFLRSVGATAFIARGSDLAVGVRRHFPAGVDAVVDCAGLGKQVVPALRDNGVLITLRPDNDNNLERGIRTEFINVRERLTDHAAITHLSQWVSSGRLPARVAAIYPASEASAAHKRLAEGGLRGRIVLDIEALGRL